MANVNATTQKVPVATGADSAAVGVAVDSAVADSVIDLNTRTVAGPILPDTSAAPVDTLAGPLPEMPTTKEMLLEQSRQGVPVSIQDPEQIKLLFQSGIPVVLIGTTSWCKASVNLPIVTAELAHMFAGRALVGTMDLDRTTTELAKSASALESALREELKAKGHAFPPIRTYPTSLVLDPSGHLLYKIDGSSPALPSQLETLLNMALSGKTVK